MGYRDEQLALRLKAEAAEKRAAEAERRRLAAQAEVDRLRIELAFTRAGPPDVALAATKRAFLVFLGGLVSLAFLVGLTLAFRAAPCEHVQPAPPMMVPLPPPMMPLEEPMQPVYRPAIARWDLELLSADDPAFAPAERCMLVGHVTHFTELPTLSGMMLACGPDRRFARFSADGELPNVAAGASDDGTHYWLDGAATVRAFDGRHYLLRASSSRAELTLTDDAGSGVARFRLRPWSDPARGQMRAAPMLAFDAREFEATIVSEGMDRGRRCHVFVSPGPTGACSVVVQCGARRGSFYWDDARCDVEAGVPQSALAPSLDLELALGEGTLAFERRRTELRFPPIAAE